MPASGGKVLIPDAPVTDVKILAAAAVGPVI